MRRLWRSKGGLVVPMFAMLIAAMLVACGGAPIAASTTSNAASVSDPASESTSTPNDPVQVAWAQRLQPASALHALQAWTQQAEADADDAARWLRVAQAEHFVASVHLTEGDQIIAHAQAGLEAATRALTLIDEDIAATLAKPGQALGTLTPDTAHAVYWHARLQLLLAGAKGYAALLIAEDQQQRAIDACERFAPEYDHFGAVILAAQRAAHPFDITRRDLSSARQRYDRVLAAEPGFLAHHVAIAENLAAIAGDRMLFERELQSANNASLPAAADAEQHIAQARARALLEQVNELFE